MEGLRAKILGEGAVVAGVLSGTSADGIDVGIARLRAGSPAHERGTPARSPLQATGRGVGESAGAPAPAMRDLLPPEPAAFSVEPFPADLAGRVRAVLDGEPCDLRESALLSRDLGRAFGRAARGLADRSGLALDLLGSHGQTVWHHDGSEPGGAATLQLGDGDYAAEEASCPVVSDFRQRDVAAGGEGAPISALVDPLLFARVPRPFAVLNLGGMANLTWIGPGEGELLAFDTGPACSLLDGLARRLLDAPFDRDGERASRGRFHPDVARAILEHPFLRRPPPKSTGRDTFGERCVADFAERGRRLSAEDLLMTAVVSVAGSVRDSMLRFLPAPPAHLVVAGGGARNRTLMRILEGEVACPLSTSERFGVDPKAREALVFAVLAARCVLGIPSTHPGATGARAGRVLGKISPGAGVP